MGDGNGSVFDDMVAPGCMSNALFIKDLRPVEEVPSRYRPIFSDYPCFNYVQSAVFDDLFYTDESMVISAPTGSGKTAIFELAIVRALMVFEGTKYENNFKIVYISPMKALCEERLVDWYKKFSDFGINCISITGDSDNVEFRSLLNHNLIITTPEKWDSLTRKWRDNQDLVQLVKLFMIDEVHLLNENNRGSTLETIVCRMKTIQETVEVQESASGNEHKIRFIAVSATIPNIVDIAEWLGELPYVKYFKFSDDVRPVKLRKIVLGYPYYPKSTPFKFDFALNYKLQDLIMQYSEGKPTLIFCSTRKIVEMTAKHILKNLTVNLSQEQKLKLVEAVKCVTDVKIRETLVFGIGYHHAGMMPETKRTIENLFRNGDLPVLVTTSTLAMGVNLPAHLVIIKSTKCYYNGQFCDYTETAISQMIGRAGRPQFDTTATALILTTLKDKPKFEKMVGGSDPIESNLHKNLTEHLNAEVVLRTITDLGVAMRWLSSTYLYIRARKNPKHYGLSMGLTPQQIDKKLLEMCQIELNKLVTAKMLTINQDVVLEPTLTGIIMAKYYLAFETMRLFTQVTGEEVLQQILMLISKCHEFSEMYLRVNDKKCLNLLNKCKNGQTIRFPLNGKIKTLDMKINCLIQAVLGCLDICDHSLLSETLRVMRNAERITKALIEYLESRKRCYRALLNIITLAKCFASKLWENSPYVSKQLSGIGAVMSAQMVGAGKSSFDVIGKTDPRVLEMIINKKPPMGDRILDQVKHLPKYSMKIERDGAKSLKLVISLENALDLENKCSVNVNSVMYLLVGDSDNNVIIYEKYTHSYMIECPDVAKTIDLKNDNLEEVEANFISEDWAGIDCNAKFVLIVKSDPPKSQGKKKTPANTASNNKKNYMQSFLEKYNEIQKRKEVNLQKRDKITVTKLENDKVDLSRKEKIIVHSIDILNNNIEQPAKSCSDNVFVIEKKNCDRASTSKLDNNADQPSSPEVLHNIEDISEEIFENMENQMENYRYEEYGDELDVDSEDVEMQSSERFTEERVGDVSMQEVSPALATTKNSMLVDQEVSVVEINRRGTLEHKKDKENVDPLELEGRTTFKSRGNINNSPSPERGHLQSIDNSNNETATSPIDVQKYRYTPQKKFSHYQKTSPQESKKIKSDQIDHKKITWRSPLVYSPPTKFSPKLNYKQQASENFENQKENFSQQISTTSDPLSQEATTSKVTKTRTSTFWPLAKLTPTKPGTAFPLSDKDCLAPSTAKERVSPPKPGPSKENLQQVMEVCSTVLLEQTGLVKTSKKEAPQVKSPNASSYYSQLISPSAKKTVDLNESFTSVKSIEVSKSPEPEIKPTSSVREEFKFSTPRGKPRESKRGSVLIAQLRSRLGASPTSSIESNESKRFHPYSSKQESRTSPVPRPKKKLSFASSQGREFKRNSRAYEDHPTSDERPTTPNRCGVDQPFINTEHSYTMPPKPVSRMGNFNVDRNQASNAEQSYTMPPRPVSRIGHFNLDRSQASNLPLAEQLFSHVESQVLEENNLKTTFEPNRSHFVKPQRFVSETGEIYVQTPSNPSLLELRQSPEEIYHHHQRKMREILFPDMLTTMRTSSFGDDHDQILRLRHAHEEASRLEANRHVFSGTEQYAPERQFSDYFEGSSRFAEPNLRNRNFRSRDRPSVGLYQSRDPLENPHRMDHSALDMLHRHREVEPAVGGFSESRVSFGDPLSNNQQSALNIIKFHEEVERQRLAARRSPPHTITKPQHLKQLSNGEQSFVRPTTPPEKLLVTESSNFQNSFHRPAEKFSNLELQRSTSTNASGRSLNPDRSFGTEADSGFGGSSSRQFQFDNNKSNKVSSTGDRRNQMLDVSRYFNNAPRFEPLSFGIRRTPEIFGRGEDENYAYVYMRSMMDLVQEDESEAFTQVPIPAHEQDGHLENNNYAVSANYGYVAEPVQNPRRGPRTPSPNGAIDCLSESTMEDGRLDEYGEVTYNEPDGNRVGLQPEVTHQNSSFMMNKFFTSMDDDDDGF